MTDRTINWVFRATDRTSQAFRSIDGRLKSVGSTLATISRFAGFGAVAGGAALLTRDLVRLGSELSDVADKLGVSAEQVQVLKFAVEQTGGSFDQLQSALQFNTKLAGEAARGNKAAADTFRLLGLDAKRFVDLPIDRRFAVIAEQLRRVEDPALRLDLTLKALGRSGGDLAPLLSQGAAGLATYEEQLRSTNSILSDEQVQALDAAGDAWDAFILRLRVGVAPALTGTLGFISDVSSALRGIADQNEQIRRSFQGLGRGPQSRRGSASRGPLSDREASAITAQAGDPAVEAARRAAEAAAKSAEAAFKRMQDAARVAQADIARIFDQTRTPLEEYLAGIQRVAELQSSGLDADTAERELRRLADVYRDVATRAYEASDAGQAWAAAQSDAARIIASLITPFEAYGSALDRIAELQNLGLLNTEQAAKAASNAAQDYADAQIAIARGNEQLADSTERLLRDIRTAAEGFARDLTDSFFDATNSIGDMFRQLAITIAKALFTQTVTGPLIQGILGGLGIPGRASGGPVTGGSPYIVGERGPELFVPRGSGSIIANGAGGTPISVNMTITSVDPQTAAQTIAAQERLITGMVRRSMLRAGVRPAMA